MSVHHSSAGLEAAYLENRDRLLRFLLARGAGEAAEDLLQEIWLKISAGNAGPVASPLSYLFRAADTLMIDRYRAASQARKRDRAWSETHDGTTPGVSDAPSVERHLIGREQARLVSETLATLGERTAAIFRRHRIDGLAQREVAGEFGVESQYGRERSAARLCRARAMKERIERLEPDVSVLLVEGVLYHGA